MTAFRRLNRLQSFRDAFGSLLQLDDAEVSVVLKAVRDSANDTSSEELVPDDLSPAYAALTILRRAAADDGVEAVLNDIKAAYRDSKVDVAKIGPMLAQSEADRERQEIREAETSTLPVVVDGRLTLDFRVLGHDDGVRLVPVFVARIDFDEPVAGSESVSFQASRDSLERMRKRLTMP